jgi:hypothetical protein
MVIAADERCSNAVNLSARVSLTGESQTNRTVKMMLRVNSAADSASITSTTLFFERIFNNDDIDRE